MFLIANNTLSHDAALSGRYLSILETFGNFKRSICNFGSSNKHIPYLLFDRSVIKMEPTHMGHTRRITLDERTQKWHTEVRPWLQYYQPTIKFDDYLCYDCCIHGCASQGGWESELTKVRDEKNVFYLKEELKTYSYPQGVKAVTCIYDQCFVHNGMEIFAYVSWTPLLQNYRGGCYSSINHPSVPVVSIYLNPTLKDVYKDQVIKKTKETLRRHVQLLQSYNNPLMYELTCDLKTNINEESEINYVTFNVYQQQKFLGLFKYLSKESADEKIALREFLKHPNQNYPEYESRPITENKQLFLQHFLQNAHLYTIEKFNLYRECYNVLDTEKDNSVLYGLFEKGATTPSGAMLVAQNQDMEAEWGYKKAKRDAIVLSIHPKEKSERRIFKNYSYTFMNDVNKMALWCLYKNVYKEHCSIKPKRNEYLMGQKPTSDHCLKTLFTYMR